jgi:cytochrome c-type biogenesis protein CcmH/NrfG
MATWAEANRRGARGEHWYRLEEYGLTTHEVAHAFAAYTDRFENVYRPAE